MRDLKNFGLYKGKTLFFTTGGTFASEAWVKSGGKNCGDVAGTRFDAFTADDGKCYNIGRFNVSPITEIELEEKLSAAHPAFKLIVELSELKPKSYSAYCDWLYYRENIANLIEKGFSIEEIREYLTKKCFI